MWRARQARKRCVALIATKKKARDSELAAKVALAQYERSVAEEKSSERWIEVFDPSQQTFYYYESNSQQTTWEKPAHYIMAADDEMMAAVIKIQTCYRRRIARVKYTKMLTEKRERDDALKSKVDRSLAERKSEEAKRMADSSMCWIEMFDPTSGRFYYYETSTKQTSWEQPQSYLQACDEPFLAAVSKTVYIYIDAYREFKIS